MNEIQVYGEILYGKHWLGALTQTTFYPRSTIQSWRDRGNMTDDAKRLLLILVRRTIKNISALINEPDVEYLLKKTGDILFFDRWVVQMRDLFKENSDMHITDAMIRSWVKKQYLEAKYQEMLIGFLKDRLYLLHVAEAAMRQNVNVVEYRISEFLKSDEYKVFSKLSLNNAQTYIISFISCTDEFGNIMYDAKISLHNNAKPLPKNAVEMGNTGEKVQQFVSNSTFKVPSLSLLSVYDPSFNVKGHLAHNEVFIEANTKDFIAGN